jgi:hypothetical protein
LLLFRPEYRKLPTHPTGPLPRSLIIQAPSHANTIQM